MKTTLILLILALSLTSCLQNLIKEEKNAKKTELVPVSINEEYSMGIPSFMTKTTILNEAASLQFQNIFKEAYVIVIDENKNEFIEAYKDLSYDSTRSLILNYADTQVQLTSSNLNVISTKDVSAFDINGLHAASSEIDANVEGVNEPISYFLTFVEGKEKLYMIMAWTLQSKKDGHRATFEQMAKSFKML